MKHVTICFPALGTDLVADIFYRITSRGCPEQGPTYASGGQPAEPPEWEIERINICIDEPNCEPPHLDVPAWLFDAIAGSDEAKQAIIEDIAAEMLSDKESA